MRVTRAWVYTLRRFCLEYVPVKHAPTSLRKRTIIQLVASDALYDGLPTLVVPQLHRGGGKLEGGAGH